MQTSQFFVIFLVILKVFSAAKVHQKIWQEITDPSATKCQLTRCILDASKNCFGKTNRIFVGFFSNETTCDNLDSLALNFLDKFSNGIILVFNKFTEAFRLSNRKTIDSGILEFTDIGGLKNGIESMRYSRIWNSSAKFIVTSANLSLSTEEVLPKVIEILWNEGIYNFVIVFAVGNVVNFYSWFPYKNGRCGLEYSKYELLGVCNGTQTCGWFPEKIPSSFDSCLLKVHGVIWPPFVMEPASQIPNSDIYVINDGLEVNLVKAVTAKLKMRLNFILSKKRWDWGEVLENGSSSGMMRAIKMQQIDVAIGSVASTRERIVFMDLSRSYFAETLTICVPQAEMQPSWRKIIDAFTYKVWIGFGVLFLIFTFLLWFLGRRYNDGYFKSYLNCLLSVYATSLGESIKRLPERPLIRLFYLFWMLFCLNFDMIYNTQLISGLTQPSYETQIKSIKEIVSNDLKLFSISGITRYYDTNSTITRDILKQHEICGNIDACMERVAYKKDRGICVPTTFLNYVRGRYVTHENLPLLYCFNSEIASYSIHMLIRKRYPLTPKINSIIARLDAGGFVVHWTKQIYEFKWKNQEIGVLNITDREFLHFGNLKSAFNFLLMGLAASFLLLICEIVYKTGTLFLEP